MCAKIKIKTFNNFINLLSAIIIIRSYLNKKIISISYRLLTINITKSIRTRTNLTPQ